MERAPRIPAPAEKAFDARGIEIPFPHITVYAGAGKDGTAPPLRVVAANNAGAAERVAQ